jgi:ribosomal protein L22
VPIVCSNFCPFFFALGNQKSKMNFLKRTLGIRFSSSTSSLIGAVLSDAKTGTKVLPPIPIFTTGNLRTSPQKLNHLARLIKGMTLKEATAQMAMVLKKRGENVRRLIVRAGCALEHNYKQKKSNFIIQEAWVGKGVYIKRVYLHGRGRTGRMSRPSAHLKIRLAEKDTRDPELLALAKQFRKHKLFVTMQDSKPVTPAYPVWSSKPWKYVTSPKWVHPENALAHNKKN